MGAFCKTPFFPLNLSHVKKKEIAANAKLPSGP